MSAFVGWHLAFLLFRNPVSIFQGEVDGWVERHARSESTAARSAADAVGSVDRIFTAYEQALALDQGWRMFVAPLARTAAFPAVLIELDDGSRVQILSENEPSQIDSYLLRPSQPRLRKHETQIASLAPQEYGLTEYWERYLSWQCQRWRERNPTDERRVARLTLLRREYSLPSPSSERPSYGAPVSEEIGSMRGAACNR